MKNIFKLIILIITVIVAIAVIVGAVIFISLFTSKQRREKMLDMWQSNGGNILCAEEIDLRVDGKTGIGTLTVNGKSYEIKMSFAVTGSDIYIWNIGNDKDEGMLGFDDLKITGDNKFCGTLYYDNYGIFGNIITVNFYYD